VLKVVLLIHIIKEVNMKQENKTIEEIEELFSALEEKTKK